MLSKIVFLTLVSYVLSNDVNETLNELQITSTTTPEPLDDYSGFGPEDLDLDINFTEPVMSKHGKKGKSHHHGKKLSKKFGNNHTHENVTAAMFQDTSNSNHVVSPVLFSVGAVCFVVGGVLLINRNRKKRGYQTVEETPITYDTFP